MPDMIVKLYELPALEPAIASQRAVGVNIRRVMTPEKFLVLGLDPRAFQRILGKRSGCGLFGSSDYGHAGASGRSNIGIRLL